MIVNIGVRPLPVLNLFTWCGRSLQDIDDLVGPEVAIDRCSTCAKFCGTICVMTTTVEELMKSAVDARRVAQNALRVAVREARAADWSWDRISAAMGGTPNGETLRRNFGDEQ
jgi:hypothetical protein